MNFTAYKYCLLLLSSFCLSATLSAPAHGITNNSQFINPSFQLAKNTKSNGKANSREYTFKAPDSKVISNTEQLIKTQGYKVEVYGNEQKLLQEVKNIEPTAFIKGNTIQVGIFSQQANAEDMVRKLTIKGFWARIKTQ